MKKLVAVVLAIAIAGCNDALEPGPFVNPPSDATAAYTAYTGEVGQIAGEQFVIYPDEAEVDLVRLAGREEQLSELVGHNAYVRGIMGTDGVLHVTECYGMNP